MPRQQRRRPGRGTGWHRPDGHQHLTDVRFQFRVLHHSGFVLGCPNHGRHRDMMGGSACTLRDEFSGRVSFGQQHMGTSVPKCACRSVDCSDDTYVGAEVKFWTASWLL